jgi:hypothetical protein
MRIKQAIQDFIDYLTDGFARIFGPSKDEYPEVGVQPFESDTYIAKEEETL